MIIIEVKAQENGAHKNQSWPDGLPTPDGWAIMPDEIDAKNFPFGDFQVSNGVVIDWSELPAPKPVPVPPTPMDIIMAQVVHSAIKSGSLLPAMKEVMGRG